MKQQAGAWLILSAGFLVCQAAAAKSGGTNGFTDHATISGIGKALNELVSKGPADTSEMLYVSRADNGGSFDIVATDPSTGSQSVFTSPLSGESVAWAMAADRDGRVYVGTAPHAHIMRLDWATRRLLDMGQPSPTETYIWQLALGRDGRLYGGTFPSSKLVRFDPATGQSSDLGQMSQSEKYARYVVADDTGFVYVGVGMVHGDLVAYDIATGRHRSILPASQKGLKVVQLVKGADGKAYAKLGTWMQLSGWTLIPYSGPPPVAPMRLKNRSLVSFSDSSVTIKSPSGQVSKHPVRYQGSPQAIFRIGVGPDSKIYGSTAIPARLFWASPTGTAWGEVAEAGAGEIYSFASWKRRLFAAAYSTPAPIFSYQPGQPWIPGSVAGSNPWLIHYKGENASWRPSAMIVAKDGSIYIGSTPGYGVLGGAISVLNPETGAVRQFANVVKNQSVSALAQLPSGLLVGGTSVVGGGGSVPSESDARLFLWNPTTQKETLELTPVPGQGTIDAIAVGKSGNIYGFAGPTLFVFDPLARKIKMLKPSSIGRVIYGALGAGPDGVLYGLTNIGVFKIDEGTNEAKMLAAYPGGITGGFAIAGGSIYFSQGSKLVSYKLQD